MQKLHSAAGGTPGGVLDTGGALGSFPGIGEGSQCGESEINHIVNSPFSVCLCSLFEQTYIKIINHLFFTSRPPLMITVGGSL